MGIIYALCDVERGERYELGKGSWQALLQEDYEYDSPLVTLPPAEELRHLIFREVFHGEDGDPWLDTSAPKIAAHITAWAHGRGQLFLDHDCSSSTFYDRCKLHASRYQPFGESDQDLPFKLEPTQ